MFEVAHSAEHEHATLNEIWISFGSLLRSYVAAAQIGSAEPQARVEIEVDRITLTRGDVRLVLDREAGRWEFADHAGVFAHGSFSLDAESRVTWQGQLQPLELDQAAELITERFFETEREGDPDTEAEAAGEAGGE